MPATLCDLASDCGSEPQPHVGRCVLPSDPHAERIAQRSRRADLGPGREVLTGLLYRNDTLDREHADAAPPATVCDQEQPFQRSIGVKLTGLDHTVRDI